MAARHKRIIKDADFKNIFQTGKTTAGRFVFLRTKKTKNRECRLCFVAGLKVSKKATERNKAKRRIRALTDVIYSDLIPGHDIVFIAKKEILKAKYPEIKEDLLNALEKAKTFKRQ